MSDERSSADAPLPFRRATPPPVVPGVIVEQGKAVPDEDASADYSGNIRIPMPRSLHHEVTQIAEIRPAKGTQAAAL